MIMNNDYGVDVIHWNFILSIEKKLKTEFCWEISCMCKIIDRPQQQQQQQQ